MCTRTFYRGRVQLQPGKLAGYGLALQRRDVVFSVERRGDAAGHGAPVVQDASNVRDSWVPFAIAEEEFEILNAVEMGIESAKRERFLAPHAQQVPDIHDAAEEFGGPVWFAERLTARAFPGGFIGVGVDRVRVKHPRKAQLDRVGNQQIVVVEETDVRRPC